MAGLVDEDGQVAVDAVEHCDVAVRIVGGGHAGCAKNFVKRVMKKKGGSLRSGRLMMWRTY